MLALLGIDISQTVADGTSVGGAFIEGFKKGFDTEKITEALKEWAENNKEIVIGIGAIVGFNLITGLAGKLNDLTSLFNKGSGNSSGSSSLGDLVTNCTTATVYGTVVNVYGAKINEAGDTARKVVETGSGGNHFDIKIELSPEFIIETRNSGADEESIIAILKARIREMVDDIGDELAERLARIFANMPVKGAA